MIGIAKKAVCAGLIDMPIRLISLGHKREYFRAVQQQFHLLIPPSTDEFIPHNKVKRISEIADVWGAILLIHLVSSLYDAAVLGAMVAFMRL